MYHIGKITRHSIGKMRNMDKFDFLDEKLTDLQEKHLFRSLNCIDSDKVVLCSNDYLNIADDKRVKDADPALID